MAWGSISLFASFLEKENSLETLIVIFENVSLKGFFWLNMKNFEISVLTANSRYLQTAALISFLKLIKAWRLRIFTDTLILVLVNENCCLRTCFTELYFLYWFLVVSLVILIAAPFVFSRSGVLKIPCVSNAYTSIKPLNIIMLEGNFINVHSNTRPQLALQKWEPAGRIGDFGQFFLTV